MRIISLKFNSLRLKRLSIIGTPPMALIAGFLAYNFVGWPPAVDAGPGNLKLACYVTEKMNTDVLKYLHGVSARWDRDSCAIALYKATNGKGLDALDPDLGRHVDYGKDEIALYNEANLVGTDWEAASASFRQLREDADHAHSIALSLVWGCIALISLATAGALWLAFLSLDWALRPPL